MSIKRKIFSESQLLKKDAPTVVRQMVGGVYGWLTVKRYAGHSILSNGKCGSAYIMCECKCGKLVLAQYSHVKNGKWVSCGCKKIEKHPRFKHGLAGKRDKLYQTWKGINKRCFTKSDNAYCRYGAVGITVCDGWRGNDGFLNFKNDIGLPPSKEFSIDRIDPLKNYSCGHCHQCIKNGWEANCRWADKYTQARNKTSNRYINLNGAKLTLAEADRKLGFNRGVLADRLSRGWSTEKSIKTPIVGKKEPRTVKKSITTSKIFIEIINRLVPL